METIKIISGLAGFMLLSGISEVSEDQIHAEAVFGDHPQFAGVEVMAQAAAMHVRYMVQFKRHAFLLSIQQCCMPRVEKLTGHFLVQAKMRHRSSEVFGYHVTGSGHDGVAFESELLIGTRPFDDRFRKKVLSRHYEQVWKRLKDE